MKATACKKLMAFLLMVALLLCAMPMAAAAETALDENLKFERAALTLEDNLSIGFKVKNTLLENYTDPYAVFVFGGEESTVYTYTEVEGYYVFKFSDIAPHKMNDTVSATLYATNNGTEYCGDAVEYSVAQYCYSLLETETNTELLTLLVDLLNYGAQSQIFKGYNTENLVNATLSDEQKAYATATDPQLTDALNTAYATVASPTATWKGASLILDDAVTIRLKLAVNNVYGVNIKAWTEAGQTWTIKNNKLAPHATESGVYYAEFSELNAAQMREVVYFQICDRTGNAISNTVCYSVESYAARKQDVSGLSDLVKSMMKYGDSAKAYVS